MLRARTFGTRYTYRRISGADRLFLVREVLLGVGVGFIDKVHADCDSAMVSTDEIVGGMKQGYLCDERTPD